MLTILCALVFLLNYVHTDKNRIYESVETKSFVYFCYVPTIYTKENAVTFSCEESCTSGKLGRK